MKRRTTFLERQLGVRFANLLIDNCTMEEERRVIHGNWVLKVNGEHNICASHDVCDANMVMEGAMQAMKNLPSYSKLGDIWADDLWNNAWSYAKEFILTGDSETSYCSNRVRVTELLLHEIARDLNRATGAPMEWATRLSLTGFSPNRGHYNVRHNFRCGKNYYDLTVRGDMHQVPVVTAETHIELLDKILEFYAEKVGSPLTEPEQYVELDIPVTIVAPDRRSDADGEYKIVGYDETSQFCKLEGVPAPDEASTWYPAHELRNVERLIDLFEHQDRLPECIQVIVNSFDENKDPYKECARMEAELEPYGYEFEWGLDGIPFNLREEVSDEKE